ncbi:CoA transferase [Nocardioides eburneiflavus]|uniref:CoA transferase n=1 Tax=Nocardioides eburneiflavus TaxID=2518372 RepID=A0A4Z1CIH3_9ACTN|nr:CaiB/BaiF CoA-transferase family protein [Nocardioides eburneiflavus]TGN65767.1 CoA transferase [Nocardioides eburneiflavus]
MTSNLPLQGYLVADFSRVLAGPLATSTLADLGARVVKVERPGSGDDTRTWGPPWTISSSSYFECANRSKESVVLDLDDASDIALARRLAQRADIVVENFRDGVMTQRGLDYATLSATNPGLVFCSVTGFGSGQGAALPGYDFLVQAVGGLMSITGEPGESPTKVGVALVDVLTGKDAVIGILAAIAERSISGRGQRVEVNLLSSLLGSLANQGASFLATGTSPERAGNQHPSIAPYETLQCQDDVLVVCCGNDAQFHRLCDVLGRPELIHDQRFGTNHSRVAHRDDLVLLLEQALARDTAEAWTAKLTSARVSAGRVNTIAEAFDLATALELNPLVPIADATPQVRHPITYSRTPVTEYQAPPQLDQNGDDIRRWLQEETP